MDESSNDERDTKMQEKKDFIQTEIIDKKYDIDEFTNFLRKVKGDEDIDLSKWSITEIKAIVGQFQNEKEVEKKRDQMDNITINSSFVATKANKDNIIPDDDDESNYIYTVKQQKGFLSDHPTLTFQISNIEKISGYFFLTNDFQFTIEVSELNSKVIRTLTDFQWLKDSLELYYPTTYIPPLPTFSFFSLSKPCYLKRKANYLKMFLGSLSQNPLIISTVLFTDFLILSKEELSKHRKEYDESDPPTKIKKFPTMEGMICIAANSAKDTEAEFMKKNISLKSDCYIKLNAAIKEVILEFNVISGKMKKLSEAFSAISKVHNDIPFVRQVYTDFEELTMRYATSYLNQQTFFKEDLQQYFKYTNKMFNNFTSCVDDFEKAKSEYLTNYVANMSTLKRRQLDHLTILKKQYGYCLNRVVNEHNRLKQISANLLSFHLKNINAQKEKMFEDYLAFVSLLEGKRKGESLSSSSKSLI